jgi:sigma54-dependent transcription regulator
MAQYDPKDHLAKAVERVKVRDRLDMPNVLEIMSYSRNLLEARRQGIGVLGSHRGQGAQDDEVEGALQEFGLVGRSYRHSVRE